MLQHAAFNALCVLLVAFVYAVAGCANGDVPRKAIVDTDQTVVSLECSTSIAHLEIVRHELALMGQLANDTSSVHHLLSDQFVQLIRLANEATPEEDRAGAQMRLALGSELHRQISELGSHEALAPDALGVPEFSAVDADTSAAELNVVAAAMSAVSLERERLGASMLQLSEREAQHRAELVGCDVEVPPPPAYGVSRDPALHSSNVAAAWEANQIDALSMTQSLQQAMTAVSNVLEDMLDLAATASTETLHDDDRAGLQDIFSELSSHIDRIAQATSHSDWSLADGTNTVAKLLTSPDPLAHTLLSLPNLTAATLGVDNASVDVSTSSQSQTSLTDLESAQATVATYMTTFDHQTAPLTDVSGLPLTPDSIGFDPVPWVTTPSSDDCSDLSSWHAGLLSGLEQVDADRLALAETHQLIAEQAEWLTRSAGEFVSIETENGAIDNLVDIGELLQVQTDGLGLSEPKTYVVGEGEVGVLTLQRADVSLTHLGIDNLDLSSALDRAIALDTVDNAMVAVATERHALDAHHFALSVHEQRIANALAPCDAPIELPPTASATWDASNATAARQWRLVLNRLDALTGLSALRLTIDEEEGILELIRQLAIASSSDDLPDESRAFIQNDFVDLANDLDRLAQTQVLDGRFYLNGTQTAATIHAIDVPWPAYQLDVLLADTTPTTLGVDTGSIDLSTAAGAQTAQTSLDVALDTLGGYRANLDATTLVLLHSMSL